MSTDNSDQLRKMHKLSELSNTLTNKKKVQRRQSKRMNSKNDKLQRNKAGDNQIGGSLQGDEHVGTMESTPHQKAPRARENERFWIKMCVDNAENDGTTNVQFTKENDGSWKEKGSWNILDTTTKMFLIFKKDGGNWSLIAEKADPSPLIKVPIFTQSEAGELQNKTVEWNKITTIPDGFDIKVKQGDDIEDLSTEATDLLRQLFTNTDKAAVKLMESVLGDAEVTGAEEAAAAAAAGAARAMEVRKLQYPCLDEINPTPSQPNPYPSHHPNHYIGKPRIGEGIFEALVKNKIIGHYTKTINGTDVIYMSPFTMPFSMIVPNEDTTRYPYFVETFQSREFDITGKKKYSDIILAQSALSKKWSININGPHINKINESSTGENLKILAIFLTNNNNKVGQEWFSNDSKTILTFDSSGGPPDNYYLNIIVENKGKQQLLVLKKEGITEISKYLIDVLL